MGFTREDIVKEAEKAFKKFTIDDGPNGPIDIVSIFRVPTNVQELVRERQRELGKMEDDEDASVEDLHEALLRVLEPLSSSREDLRTYCADFPTSDLLSLYQMWGEQTQPSKSA